LTDCWFTLAALELREGEEGECARLQRLIRQSGGRIFDAKRTGLAAAAGPGAAYAVCPLGFPRPAVAEALRRPDFRMGVPLRRPFCIAVSLQ
jgi:hypothetical protein